jgi:hypothetical protein
VFSVAFQGVERIAPAFFTRALIGLERGSSHDLPRIDFFNQFGLGVTRHPQGSAGFIEPVDFAIEIVKPEEDADNEEGNGANL